MQELSKCCKAEIKLGGDEGEGTHYYICSKCNNPCALYEENEIEKMSNDELLDIISETKFSERYKPARQEIIKRLNTPNEDIKSEILLRLSKNNIDNKYVLDLLEEVYNGIYGTKNRVQLIQKLERIKNLSNIEEFKKILLDNIDGCQWSCNDCEGNWADKAIDIIKNLHKYDIRAIKFNNIERNK